MKKRAYVLIFFFWAFLTIITPTLVQWSADAAANAATGGSQPQEDETVDLGKENSIKRITGPWKLMEYLIQEIHRRKATPALGIEILQAPPAAPPPREDRRKVEGEVIKEASSKQVLLTSRRLLQRG